MLHTTLVLSIVLSFCLLNRNFPPNNPSALSIFNYRLGLFYLIDCRQGCQVCVTKPAQCPIKTSSMANKTSSISELKICPCQTIYTAFKVQQHCYHCQMYCNIYKVTPNVKYASIKS